MIQPIGTTEVDDSMCGACGHFDAASWTLWVESDALRRHCDHRARFRLCDEHYRRLMQWMLETPDHDPARPLRGYT